jgi:hypothetical protein
MNVKVPTLIKTYVTFVIRVETEMEINTVLKVVSLVASFGHSQTSLVD